MCYVDATERCAVSIYCVSFEWPVSPGMKNLLQNNRMMRQPSKRQRSKKKKDTHQIYNKKTTTTTMLRNMRSRSRSKDCINNHFANKGLFEYFNSLRESFAASYSSFYNPNACSNGRQRATECVDVLLVFPSTNFILSV